MFLLFQLVIQLYVNINHLYLWNRRLWYRIWSTLFYLVSQKQYLWYNICELCLIKMPTSCIQYVQWSVLINESLLYKERKIAVARRYPSAAVEETPPSHPGMSSSACSKSYFRFFSSTCRERFFPSRRITILFPSPERGARDNGPTKWPRTFLPPSPITLHQRESLLFL